MISKQDHRNNYPDGTVIIIDPDADYIDGSYVLAFNKKNNHGLFRKIILDSNRRILVPNNNHYDNIDLDKNKDIIVVGKLIFSFKGQQVE